MTRSQCTMLSLLLAAASAGCEAPPSGGDVTTLQGAVNGNIVISGRVTNSSGGGLANVTVTLAGSASTSQQTTSTGAYSFGGLAAGSYSVRPSKTNCLFSPDVVNLNNLQSSTTRNFVGNGSGCAASGSGGSTGTGGAGGTGGSAGGTVTPITRKYMTIIYNPIIESQGNARLITLEGWNNPDTMAPQFVADMAQASNGIANYVAGPRVEVDAFPVSEDGFQYTDATYLTCLEASRKIPFDKTKCHKPDQADGFGYAIDYLAMLNSQNICARFNAGEFDELWIYGAPFMGLWESTQAGSQAVDANGPPIMGTTCQGRLSIFGFAYHVDEVNMLHDYGHRIDHVLKSLLPNGGPSFDEFLRYDLQNPGQAGCGITHYTPTSTFEYEYNNPRNVTSSCADWLNYPNRTGATTTINCSAWGCDERLFHIWRAQHVPHVAGVAADGSSNNWWTYILSR